MLGGGGADWLHGSSPNASAQTLLSAADLGASGGIYVPDGGGEALLFDADSGDFSPAGGDGWIIDDGATLPTGSIAW